MTAILAQVEGRSPTERSQTLMQLALLSADVGASANADQYGRMAQTTVGLSSAELGTVSAELLMQRELANAKSLQAAGRYAEADQILRRVAGYLM